MDRACGTYDPPNLFLLSTSDRQASGTTTPTVIIADRRYESRLQPGLSWAITPRREVIQGLYQLLPSAVPSGHGGSIDMASICRHETRRGNRWAAFATDIQF